MVLMVTVLGETGTDHLDELLALNHFKVVRNQVHTCFQPVSGRFKVLVQWETFLQHCILNQDNYVNEILGFTKAIRYV